MKKIASFFVSIKKKIGTAIYIIMLSVVGIVICYTNYGISSILSLATNIRQTEKFELKMADALKYYPVFNGDNYILAKEVVKEKVEENIQVTNNSTVNFDASAVDAISNIITIDKPDIKIKSTSNYTRIDLYGVTVYDYSSKDIDYKELIERNVNLTKKSDPLLLYCSHTSETYKNSENFKFSYSGNYRTKDAKYNMLSVASIMADTLNSRKLTAIFDTTPHDYTSYDNAYKNSLKTINNNLEKYGRFGVIIDVHRDAAGDLTFGPKTTINGKSTAMLMLVVGVGYEGYPNEYWEENLSLALHIAKLGEEMYPGLFRQVLVRDARYNQQIRPGSILVEVGATGNTLEEAYYGARCFANILAKLYK